MVCFVARTNKANQKYKSILLPHQTNLAFEYDLIRGIVIKVDGGSSIDFYVPNDELGINLGGGLTTSINRCVTIGRKNQPIDIKISTASNATTLNGCV